MNNPLRVTHMKWQIEEEERHRLDCQNRMCRHFQSVSYLISLMNPGGAGAAGWLRGVSGFSRARGDEWKTQGQQRAPLKVRDKTTTSGTLLH